MSEKQVFTIRLKSPAEDEISFSCGEDELILEAAKRQGIYLASYCKQGACGACAAWLVSGSISYTRDVQNAPQEPVAGDEVRSCSSKPCSDLELKTVAPWRTMGR